MAIDNGGKEDIDKNLKCFMTMGRRIVNPVLIISYETLRLHIHELMRGEIGMMFCDEGHRLKNMENQTYAALNKLNVKRRILISGTPIQNDLLEYYSLVSFVNPGLLGDQPQFRRKYENPILKGRDAYASDKEEELGKERLAELIQLVNQCMIRRTSDLLSKYLPKKIELVVCVKLTDFQTDLYRKFLKSNAVKAVVTESDESDGPRANSSLKAITLLKKLCNHPRLVFEDLKKDKDNTFRALISSFPDAFNNNAAKLQVEFSGKVKIVDTLLALIKSTTTDKVVLISNYTQTLDLFVTLCSMRGYKFVRLDGTMSIKKRGKIVETFNKPESPEFIFMLSSKAGGCGLNLIGANRLIMVSVFAVFFC